MMQQNPILMQWMQRLAPMDQLNLTPKNDTEIGYLQLVGLLIQQIEHYQKISSAPFLLAITGPIAVGKSYFTQKILSLLKLFFSDALSINTDGFIFPTEQLIQTDKLLLKGFPETYDLKAFETFLHQIKHGVTAHAPHYAVELYDRHPTQEDKIEPPLSLLILEGLNIFHSSKQPSLATYIDFIIYLDAAETNLFTWYQERRLNALAHYQSQPTALHLSPYWSQLSKLSKQEYLMDIKNTWLNVNLPNIDRHIAPYKKQAHVIVQKQINHRISDLNFIQQSSIFSENFAGNK